MLFGLLAGAALAVAAEPSRNAPAASANASLRVPVLAGASAREAITPVGFGFEFAGRWHPLRMRRGPIGFGGALWAGHDQFLERINLRDPNDGSNIRRFRSLRHTDFSVGPSVEWLGARLVVRVDAGVGVGISSFVDPQGVFPQDEVQVDATGLALRGGLELGFRVGAQSGVLFGSALRQHFTNEGPFDLVIDGRVTYAMWF